MQLKMSEGGGAYASYLAGRNNQPFELTFTPEVTTLSPKCGDPLSHMPHHLWMQCDSQTPRMDLKQCHARQEFLVSPKRFLFNVPTSVPSKHPCDEPCDSPAGSGMARFMSAFRNPSCLSVVHLLRS